MSTEAYKEAVEAMKHAYEFLLNPDEFNSACYGITLLAGKLNISRDEDEDLEDMWIKLSARKHRQYNKK